MGGTPIGSPIIGWIGEHVGARWTIVLGGVVALATAGAVLVWLALHERVRVRVRSGEAEAKGEGETEAVTDDERPVAVGSLSR
jgi:MFS family permease